MQEKQIEEVLDTLRLFQECESSIEELYGECALKWPEEKAFWSDLAAEEARHREHLENMIGLFKEDPASYVVLRPFNSTAVKTVIKGIRSSLQRVRKDELDIARILGIARDLENSLIESKFSEFLGTVNVTYNRLSRDISGETFHHRRKIDNKLKEICGKD